MNPDQGSFCLLREKFLSQSMNEKGKSYSGVNQAYNICLFSGFMTLNLTGFFLVEKNCSAICTHLSTAKLETNQSVPKSGGSTIIILDQYP